MKETTTEKKGTRERILEAAMEVFTRKGFAATKTRDIARQANINIASLHYHYRTKEELFELVVKKAMAGSADLMTSIFVSELPLHEKIRQFVAGYIDFLKQNPFIPMFILTESQKDPEKIDRLINREKMIDVLSIQLESLAAEGVIRPMKMPQFISNMISLVIFPFISKSLICFQNQMGEEDFDEFLEERKSLVSQMLIHSIYYNPPD